MALVSPLCSIKHGVLMAVLRKSETARCALYNLQVIGDILRISFSWLFPRTNTYQCVIRLTVISTQAYLLRYPKRLLERHLRTVCAYVISSTFLHSVCACWLSLLSRTDYMACSTAIIVSNNKCYGVKIFESSSRLNYSTFHQLQCAPYPPLTFRGSETPQNTWRRSPDTSLVSQHLDTSLTSFRNFRWFSTARKSSEDSNLYKVHRSLRSLLSLMAWGWCSDGILGRFSWGDRFWLTGCEDDKICIKDYGRTARD